MEFGQARPQFCEEEEEEEITGNKGIISHHHQLSQQRWRTQIYDKETSSSCNTIDRVDSANFGACEPLNITNSSTTTTNSHTRAESSDGDGGGGGSGSVCVVEKEHMFDKVVTPSDVGKLNRLVIPKQHAEKYFPLDSTTNEKGLLLNFEDRSGKPWRFRYSYWNSSQSYVMTKGWSRFVKEKKLYAGDIVSFERGAGELGKDRLYIDWRRRPDRISLVPPPLQFPQTVPLGRLFLPSSVPMASMPRDLQYVHRNYDHYHHHHHPYHHQHQLQQQTSSGYGYNVVNQGSGGSTVLYLRSSSSSSAQQAEEAVMPMVFDSVPVVHGKAAAGKRLRLFGVNVECPISEDEVLSSTTIVPNTTMAVNSLSPHHLHHQHQIASSVPQYHHPLQLRLYNNGAPQAAATELPTHELPRNREPSMSLDLDI